MLRKFKVLDEFDKKIYSVSLIDFLNKKVTVQFRGSLENCLGLDDIRLIQSTGLFDNNTIEVFETDIVSNGADSYYVSYDKIKGAYYGIHLHIKKKLLLHSLIKQNYKVMGNYYI